MTNEELKQLDEAIYNLRRAVILATVPDDRHHHVAVALNILTLLSIRAVIKNNEGGALQ